MDKFIKIFRALSDENRLRIYLLLSQAELCVCELINILNIEQSRISHGLRILKEAGLIDNHKSLFFAGLKYGIIERNGNTYSFEEFKAVGQKKFEEEFTDWDKLEEQIWSRSKWTI